MDLAELLESRNKMLQKGGGMMLGRYGPNVGSEKYVGGWGSKSSTGNSNVGGGIHNSKREEGKAAGVAGKRRG